jgi:hypothetical protein
MIFMLVRPNMNQHENAAFTHVFVEFGMLVQPPCFVEVSVPTGNGARLDMNK